MVSGRRLCVRTVKALVRDPEDLLSSFVAWDAVVLRASPRFKIKFYLLTSIYFYKHPRTLNNHKKSKIKIINIIKYNTEYK